MTTETRYPAGAPCWADLATPSREGARRFYGPLLGWTFDEPNPELGGYMNARRDGKRVAGIMELPPAEFTMAWGVHLSTPDIEASARTIVEAGGQIVMPPHDVVDLGRNLLATDPNGALFGLWQPRSFAGAERFGEPGALCWSEVCTRDAAATDRFYSSLFAYETVTMNGDCGDVDVAIFKVEGKQVFMRVKHLAGPAKDLPSHWMAYFAVDDIDAALARAPALEGKILHGPNDTPAGRIAVIADPYGAAFTIGQFPQSAS